MAELPEVETIKNDVRQLLLGRRIAGVRVLDDTLLRYPDPAPFAASLEGQEVVAAERRAKYLLIRLSSGSFLVLHFMLTGQLLLVSPRDPLRKSTRLILDLDNGQQVRLLDSSYLAQAYLLTPSELDEKLHLNELGPEPLSDELTLEEFAERLRRRRGQIKPLLLDQRFIAGIGNIYADEILFAQRIHPARDVRTLSPEEVKGLYEAIRRILRESIARRGTTVRSYRDVLGRKGHYQDCLQVFGRSGKPCPGCPGTVERIVLGGRQTFYCPSCQRLEVVHSAIMGADQENAAHERQEDAL